MMRDQPSRSWTLGPILVFVGLCAVWLASRIEHPGLGNNQDPGPSAFPFILGCCLVAGGLWELGGTILARRRHAATLNTHHASRLTSASPDLASSELSPEGRTNLMVLLPTLLVYILALPWLGFALSTLLFASFMMIRLGVVWKWSLPMAALLVAGIHLLFTQAFKVQFPAGVIPWPW